MSAQISYNAIVEQLMSFGCSREKAEATAREEHGLAPSIKSDADAQLEDARVENDVVDAADKQMRALGFRVISQSQPRYAKYLTPGIPDRLYFHRGRGVAVYWEAKSPAKYKTPSHGQSSAQADFEADCIAAGWSYVLGTERQLYDWLVEHGIAAWTVGDLLISLPYDGQQRRSA